MTPDYSTLLAKIATAVDSIAYPPAYKSVLDVVSLAISVATVVLLWRYTYLTKRLWETAQQQAVAAKAAIRETHLQGERSLLPVVAFDWENIPRDGRGFYGVLALKNAGNGAALGIFIHPVDCPNGATVTIEHSHLISPNGRERAVMVLRKKGAEDRRIVTVAAIRKLFEEEALSNPCNFRISYRNLNGVDYQTAASIGLGLGAFNSDVLLTVIEPRRVTEGDGFFRKSGTWN